MTRPPRRPCVFSVQATVSPRVVIAVQPRLLADLLGRRLASSEYDVVIALDPPHAITADIAIIMDELPPGVSADVVVRLQSDDGSLAVPSGTEAPGVGDLSVLVETVHQLLGL